MFSLLVINEGGLGIEVAPAIRAQPILCPATRSGIFHFYPAPEKGTEVRSRSKKLRNRSGFNRIKEDKNYRSNLILCIKDLDNLSGGVEVCPGAYEGQTRNILLKKIFLKQYLIIQNLDLNQDPI
jgi:hypothetical protein